MSAIRQRSEVPFEIHHDDMSRDELEDDLETVDESKAEGDEDCQEDDYEEGSDYSDDAVDGAVQEDMLRLQSFAGIKNAFRLIKRIGEGRLIH